MNLNQNGDSNEKREHIDYLQDIKTIFATLRALEIIGEATKKVPGAVKNNYPNVPWREMAGIRDKLIHDYFGVDMKVVWKTIKKDIPALRPQIKRILSEEDSS